MTTLITCGLFAAVLAPWPFAARHIRADALRRDQDQAIALGNSWRLS